jgi:hypothetical protein
MGCNSSRTHIMNGLQFKPHPYKASSVLTQHWGFVHCTMGCCVCKGHLTNSKVTRPTVYLLLLAPNWPAAACNYSSCRTCASASTSHSPLLLSLVPASYSCCCCCCPASTAKLCSPLRQAAVVVSGSAGQLTPAQHRCSAACPVSCCCCAGVIRLLQSLSAPPGWHSRCSRLQEGSAQEQKQACNSEGRAQGTVCICIPPRLNSWCVHTIHTHTYSMHECT